MSTNMSDQISKSNYQASIPGYLIKEKIDEGSNSTLFRGLRESDSIPVVIKFFKNSVMNSVLFSELKSEYEILKNLNDPHIIRVFNLEVTAVGLVLITEDLEGHTLEDYIIENKYVNLDLFFKCALQMVQALNVLHKKNITHREIKPSHFIMNHDQQLIKLSDFSISVLDSNSQSQSQSQSKSALLLGLESLFYLSPEQTGRMNRTLDYRTDFYSLGITFYYMLSGQLPFYSTDPLEIIYFHMAKEMPELQNENFEIPSMLSEIIQKLLSKSSEDRYQSALGLKEDLTQCFNDWKLKKTSAPFSLGLKDIPHRLKLSEKFYGRELEIKNLFELFKSFTESNSKPLVFVSGYSGIGKSSLIRELQKPLVKERGYFLTGKYDPYQLDRPYLGIIVALNQLLNQILGESEDQLRHWKSLINQKLNSLGGVLTEFFPVLTKIIGEQEPVIVLSAEDSEKRFYQVFIRFLSALATQEHPLVLFLDDLQWADFASFKLLNILMNAKELHSIFFICSYRDHEITNSHPLIDFKSNLSSLSFTELNLQALTESDILHLVSDTFRKTQKECLEISKIIFQKTSGNPFYAQQMLKTFYEQKWIVLEEDRGWQWDLQKIKDFPVSSNVIEFMTEKLKSLAPETLHFIKMGSVMGSIIDLDILAQISHKFADEIYQKLQPAIYDEFLIVRENQIRFQHDRIQEAAYLLLDSETKSKLHYQIGWAIYKNALVPKMESVTPSTKEVFSLTGNEFQYKELLKDQIFEIVNHLTFGETFVTDISEKEELAYVNLIAGERAYSNFVYKRAIDLFNKALSLYGENSWLKHYEQTLFIFKKISRSYRALSDFQSAENSLDYALTKTKSQLDRGEIQIERLILKTYIGQYKESIQIGVSSLKEFGIHLSETPSTLAVLWSLLSAQKAIKKRSVESIVNGPTYTDRRDYIIISLLIELGAPTYVIGSKLAPIVIALIVQRSLEFGNCDFSASGYSGLIVMNMLIFKDYDFCRKLNDIAFQLNKKYPNPFVLARMSYIELMFAKYFYASAKTLRDDVFQVYNLCARSGQKFYGEYSSVAFVDYLMIYSANINDYYQFMCRWDEYMKNAGSQLLKVIFAKDKNLIRMMTGESKLQFSFEGFPEDENLFLDQLAKAQNYPGLITYVSKVFLYHYILGDYSQCSIYLKYVDLCLGKIKGYLQELVLRVFRGLYWASQYSLTQNLTEQKRALKSVQAEIKWLAKLEQRCPENYRSLYLLLQAEEAYMLSKKELASTLFEQSIEIAHQDKWPFLLALASEHTARFYLTDKKYRIASVYLNDALKSYLKWGGILKAQQLKSTYKDLLNEAVVDNDTISPTKKKDSDSLIIKSGNSVSLNETIDFMSILKTSRIISQEVSLEKLLNQVMGAMMENAGAQKCMLFLNRSRHQNQTEGEFKSSELMDWKLEASSEEVDGQRRVVVMQDLLLNHKSKLPLQLISYVLRTGQSMVLPNAQNSLEFQNEIYFSKYNVLSVLALPIISQGHTIGILYFENNWMENAFSKDRIEVLSLLSGQVAVSINNALLYSHLEEEIHERVKDIRSLMDNVRVGIFTFGPQFKINEEYSQHLKKIFKREQLTGIYFYDLLFKDSNLEADKSKHFLEIFKSCFGEEILQFKINSSHLPSEIKLKEGSQILQVDWVPIENKEQIIVKFMVSIRDITALREAEVKAQKQARDLKMIGELLAIESERFEFFVEDCERLIDAGLLNLRSIKQEDLKINIEKLISVAQICFRILHTLKGNARAFNLTNITLLVHTIEEFYTQFLNHPTMDTWNSESQLNQFIEIRQVVQDYAVLFHKNWGQKNISFDADWNKVLKMIEFKDYKGVHQLVYQKTSRTWKDWAAPLVTNLSLLSTQLSKPIPHVELLGPDIYVGQQEGGKLTAILNHLLTNSMTHGLPASTAGRITIVLQKEKNKYVISFSDSGRGLDLLKLKDLAIAKANAHSHSHSSLNTNININLNTNINVNVNDSDDVIAASLFNDGISTAKEVTEFAGRGIGMSAVKQMMIEMKSKIEIQFTGNSDTDGFRPFRYLLIFPETLFFDKSNYEPIQSVS